MADDTCPNCGAARRYEERYDCGTFTADGGFLSRECYQRQLAAVTAERDALRQRLAEAPVVYGILDEDDVVGVVLRKSLADAAVQEQRDVNGAWLSAKSFRLVEVTNVEQSQDSLSPYEVTRVRLVRDDDSE